MAPIRAIAVCASARIYFEDGCRVAIGGGDPTENSVIEVIIVAYSTRPHVVQIRLPLLPPVS